MTKLKRVFEPSPTSTETIMATDASIQNNKFTAQAK